MEKIKCMIFLFLLLCFAWVHKSLAQGARTSQSLSVDTTTYNLERRIDALERNHNELHQKQKILLEAADERNEQLQTLLQWLGVAFIVLTVVFGGMAAVGGWRQSRQQGSLIGAHVRSAQSVSDVLAVVQNILDNRLLRVEEEQKEIKNLRTELEDLTQIVKGLKSGVEFQQSRLESTADELALIPRHNFKKAANAQALNDFARDFDNFKSQNPEKKLSGQCLYIRGIAAVFNDKFKEIDEYLSQVITLESPKADSELPSLKRLTNAYYYLGLNHSNVGELEDAIRLLEQAHKRDPQGTDFLTRLVMAEVYAMSGQYNDAERFLQEVDKGLDTLKRKQRDRLESHQLRLHSRAYLIRTNITLLEKAGDWKERAKEDAEMARKTDPEYYYALFNSGQILQKLGNNEEIVRAKKLFGDAYSSIQESGHLLFVKETRIRILLLMVAAICGKHSEIINGRTVDKYLDEAVSLRHDLPKIDNRVCTVFSPLSKLNEKPETIINHIEKIREGSVLLL